MSTLDIEAPQATTQYNDDYRPFDDEDFAPRDEVMCQDSPCDITLGDAIRNVVFCDCYSCCLGQIWCEWFSWCCWHSSMS